MFDKTLDAAIGKTALLAESFGEVHHQLEETKSKIIEEALLQIGAAGEQERTRIAEVVTTQIDLVRKKVETARESAEEITDDFDVSLIGREASILRTLLEEGSTMQAWQIAKRRASVSSTTEVVRLSISLVNRGLVIYQGDGLILTPRGRKIAERIIELNPHVVEE